MSKDSEYDKRCANLRRARRIRNRLLELRADKFTVGEILAVMKEPHFATATLDLDDMLEIADGKPVATEFREEAYR